VERAGRWGEVAGRCWRIDKKIRKWKKRKGRQINEEPNFIHLKQNPNNLCFGEKAKMV